MSTLRHKNVIIAVTIIKKYLKYRLTIKNNVHNAIPLIT